MIMRIILLILKINSNLQYEPYLKNQRLYQAFLSPFFQLQGRSIRKLVTKVFLFVQPIIKKILILFYFISRFCSGRKVDLFEHQFLKFQKLLDYYLV